MVYSHSPTKKGYCDTDRIRFKYSICITFVRFSHVKYKWRTSKHCLTPSLILSFWAAYLRFMTLKIMHYVDFLRYSNYNILNVVCNTWHVFMNARIRKRERDQGLPKYKNCSQWWETKVQNLIHLIQYVSGSTQFNCRLSGLFMLNITE